MKSPYTIFVPMQIKLCVDRGFQRVRGDMTLLFSGMFANGKMALDVGSVFSNLPNNTTALYSKGAFLFFDILLTSFVGALEVRSASRNLFLESALPLQIII